MDPKIWVRNLTGNARQISISMVEKLKAQGWVVIESKDLDSYGRPKQQYHPSFDKNNPTRERRITVDETQNPKNVLKIEPF